jgi:hypothetical protein
MPGANPEAAAKAERSVIVASFMVGCYLLGVCYWQILLLKWFGCAGAAGRCVAMGDDVPPPSVSAYIVNLANIHTNLL